MALPTRYVDWATVNENSPEGAPNKVDVPLEFQESGLKAGEPLPRAYLNDQLNLLGQWVRGLEEEINSIVITPSIAIIQQIFPVGSIWTTEGAQDPATQLGFGTWSKIQGKFLVGFATSDPDFGVVGSSGGSKTHTHTHNISTASGGSHTHTVSRDGWGVYQINGGHPEGSGTAGRIVTSSGNNEIGEKLESIGEANQDRTTSSNGSHTHGINGGISSATTLPPYQVVNHWKRTA